MHCYEILFSGTLLYLTAKSEDSESNSVLVRVPDYLDVISDPMDLSTVKEKLECGRYSRDEELLSDVALIFHNCYTYNQDTHPVTRAGYRLEKYLMKRCKELGLPPLPESNPAEDEDDAPLKRASQEESEDVPKTKRPKLN
ncbi:unnamed protein product [Leptidea sinapis]|uniref:Bromo domain-containing protein n=1 Tax=Leptidea sinapis TaxID=189913 RepID=A0A5E4R4S2_9NEOP|nr:unnamed protein product [Leptidea sinapis]